jgi:hypothetical protein
MTASNRSAHRWLPVARLGFDELASDAQLSAGLDAHVSSRSLP